MNTKIGAKKVYRIDPRGVFYPIICTSKVGSSLFAAKTLIVIYIVGFFAVRERERERERRRQHLVNENTETLWSSESSFIRNLFGVLYLE